MTAYRLALVTTFATFALLLVGGTVNPTGSSLACPDWPLCYGTAFPEMVGGVRFEWTHRLVAWAVGLFTVSLAVVVARTRSASHPRDRVTRRLAVLAVGLVVVQGLLGAITVHYELPTLVSTAHLAVAMGFFLLLIYLAFRLRPSGADAPASGTWVRRGPAFLALGLAYTQVVLGGFVRHTGAAFACGDDFPLCGGRLWPELWAARLQVVHRALGVVVLLVVAGVAFTNAARAHAAGRPLARVATLAAPMIAIAQVVLGIVTVRSGIALAPVMAHFTVAIVLLATLAIVVYALGPQGVARAKAVGVAGRAGVAQAGA